MPWEEFWALTPHEFQLRLEGARRRARDSAWRFANVVAAAANAFGGGRVRPADLVDQMVVCPVDFADGESLDDDALSPTDIEEAAAENRRLRAEMEQARAKAWAAEWEGYGDVVVTDEDLEDACLE